VAGPRGIPCNERSRYPLPVGLTLHAAVVAVFDHPVIQRCQAHYADLRIMPMLLGNPLQGGGFLLARSA
jgi:hypothetical protein